MCSSDLSGGVEVLYRKKLNHHGTRIENEMGDGGIPQTAGDDVNQTEQQSHGENASKFEGGKVNRGKNKGLKNYGGAFTTEGIARHLRHQATKNQFFKNGGKDSENPDAYPQFCVCFHVEHGFKYGLTFGIEFRK